MQINPSIVANFFLKKSESDGIPITLMKLLKLVYIAHGWSLAIFNTEEGILGGEIPEAWKLGPVIPSLYHEFKHFRNTPIERFSETTVNETEESFDLKPIFIEKTDIKDRDRLLELFTAVWESYKDYSAWGLSLKTHEDDTPWKSVYQEGKRELQIPNSLTKSYYKNFLEKMSGANE